MSAVTKKQARQGFAPGKGHAESFPLGMPAAGQFQKELEKVPGYRATIARPVSGTLPGPDSPETLQSGPLQGSGRT